MSHTPTPWIKGFDDRITVPGDSTGGQSVAHFYSHGHDCIANRDFALKACNSHDALVEAVMSVKRKLHFGTGGDWSEVIALIEAAQAKVEATP